MNSVQSIHGEYVPPSGDVREVAQSLRQLADAIEQGRYGNILHVGTLVDNGHELFTIHRSTQHSTNMEWAGLLQCAIHQVFK